MSKIEIKYENDILEISKTTTRKTETEKYDISLLEIGKQYKTNLKVSKKKDMNRVLYFEKINSVIQDEDFEDAEDEEVEENRIKKQPVIVVFSEEEKIKFMYCTYENAYKTLLKVKYKVVGISLNKRRVRIRVFAYIVNKYKIKYGEQLFYIDKKTSKSCKLKQYSAPISKLKMIKDRNYFSFKFKIKDLLEDQSEINGPVRFSINIDGTEIDYKVGKKEKNIKNVVYYYNPMMGIYVKDFAVHIRRSKIGSLMFVKRLKEPIENTIKFRFLESRFVSKIMYSIGNFVSKHRKTKTNVFYEKFSSKVEEGAYDLFLLFQQHKNTKNYFIIDEHSPDYEGIKDNPGVVKKYSFKYYWVAYSANNWIATEAPSHLNIIRSNNGILRRAFADKKFIFLQHGVTYLKAHGANSTFRKGKEGEVDYIVAGSEKERDAIVDMLEINEEQVLITGLPIFSKIKYNHINQDTEDCVALMLTWKPYEEHLYNYEESMTYKNTVEVYEMLSKYIDKDKIIVTAHPKALELMKNTSLKDSLWNRPYSEMLEKAKLIITDYSSVCYNSFYQGAGVIFYQPDLEKFETDNGELVPRDDEYIGKRVYKIDKLEEIVKQTIKDGKIDLNEVRNEKFEKNYKSINEFSDGKNIDRIYEELMKINII